MSISQVKIHFVDRQLFKYPIEKISRQNFDLLIVLLYWLKFIKKKKKKPFTWKKYCTIIN